MKCSRTCLKLLAPLALLVGAAAQAQAGITVDGDWLDWGIDVVGGHLVYNAAYGYTGYPAGTRDYNPPPVTIGAQWIYCDIEDSDDSAGLAAAVGPLYGGQDYDAEFLGVTVDDDYLYVAICTGQRPDNGSGRFGPGDILIRDDTGRYYGIEVGGGQGSYSRHTGEITSGDPGTFYSLESGGYTHNAVNLTSEQVAGSVWSTEWSATYWTFGIPGSDGIPVQLKNLESAYDRLGLAEAYFYNYTSDLDPHAFIELRVGLELFASDVELVGWGPSCGNDLLCLDADISSPPSSPEPASLAVWALLTLSFGGRSLWRRRRTRQRSAR